MVENGEISIIRRLSSSLLSTPSLGKQAITSYPIVIGHIIFGAIVLVSAAFFIPQNMGLFFGLFLPATFGVLGSFAVFEYRNEKKKAKLRRAFLAEIEAMKPLISVQTSAMLDPMGPLDPAQAQLPADNYIITDTYRSNISEIGILPEKEIEVLTQFYSNAIRTSRTIESGEEAAETSLISFNTSWCVLNNLAQEASYHLRNQLSDDDYFSQEEDISLYVTSEVINQLATHRPMETVVVEPDEMALEKIGNLGEKQEFVKSMDDVVVLAGTIEEEGAAQFAPSEIVEIGLEGELILQALSVAEEPLPVNELTEILPDIQKVTEEYNELVKRELVEQTQSNKYMITLKGEQYIED